MNEKLLYHEVRELGNACALSIDRIAHNCEVNQYLVTDLFIKYFEMVIGEMKKKSQNEK